MQYGRILYVIMYLFTVMCITVTSQEPFQMRKHEAELYKQFAVQADISNDWLNELNNRLASYTYPTNFQSTGTNHLFQAYPSFQATIPYLSFAQLPTPIVHLSNISDEFGVPLFMKNDALTGGRDNEGSPIYGGNKVRKLEFLLAHAKSLGATKIATFGCVASNHAIATTVHGHRQGFDTVIAMLCHQPPSRAVQHNLLMHQAYGSELQYSANNDIRKMATLAMWCDHLKKDGQVPYMIPTGGSNAIGTLGYVNAVFELMAQIQQGVMPKPTHIYVAAGSCATVAGILLGCKATGLDAKVVAIAVHPAKESYFSNTIETLFKQTNALLHSKDSSFGEFTYSDDDLFIDESETGRGYGVFTQEGCQAAAKIAASEGITLDGTYTAKVFSALLKHIQQNPAQVALFWNTYSGLDFSHLIQNQDYRDLPYCFHDYFDDRNLQELDQANT